MIKKTLKDGKLTFQVTVVPRASRSEIVGEHNGTLRVRIAAPPVDGAANSELVRVLSKALKVPRADVEIIAGKSSKIKTVSVKGAKGELLTEGTDGG